MTSSGSNFISEWFGVRLYPEPLCTSSDIDAFRARQCPFLTDTLAKPTACIKSENALGVCTITTSRGGLRDWIVCPYRVLERSILHEVARKIFGDPRDSLDIFPVVHLQDPEKCSAILEKARNSTVYLFFQDKLGGEINVIGTDRTPELSFDITIVACRAQDDWLLLDRYGIFEAQTMDFHGSYKHAVSALLSAVDLHGQEFPQVIKEKQEWLARKIEGPNIANVFKRTIYQLILKFDMAGRDRCAGVVLGLPEPVWQSWGPHLGGLDWATSHEGVSRNSWIFVLAPDIRPETSPNRIILKEEIAIDSAKLIDRAFGAVPDRIASDTLPGVFLSIVRRTQGFYPNTKQEK
jgi:hypothetical protein